MVTAIHPLPHMYNIQKVKAIFLHSCSPIKIGKSLRKENRIGVLGVCAGGGCAVSAIMTKRRIKASGVVTGANVGRVQRESRNPTLVLKGVIRQRTPETRGGDPLSQTRFPVVRKKGKRRVSTSENPLVLEHQVTTVCIADGMRGKNGKIIKIVVLSGEGHCFRICIEGRLRT